MGRKRQIKDKILKERDRVGVILDLLYACTLILGVIVMVKIAWIQLSYKVDDKVVNLFRPGETRKTDAPERGTILDQNGKILAISTPLYQLYMDCTVQRDNFRKDKEQGQAKEAQWRKDAGELAKGLSSMFGDKSAKEYEALIINSRENGRKNVKIGTTIDHETLKKARQLPLFREGQFKGGLIVRKIDTRQYPYGSLARRTIGYVKDNSQSNGNNKIGLEGKYDYELHGREGYEWLRKTEDGMRVHDFDSTSVEARDGNDVRTTLDIDYQDLADRALRNQITDDERVSGGVVILMEVKTGAIRAMVNLQRDTIPGSPLQERYNLAIGQIGEPGSVFKSVSLMSLLEDGYVKSIEETIPTNHGKVGDYNIDQHIIDYERQTGRREITVRHGLEISSNYVFTYLITKYYGDHYKDYVDKIYSYRLAEKFDFDLEGLGAPQVLPVNSPEWKRKGLGSVAYGYSIGVTPLHLITFYNAIANKGRMMKPYLVESIEENGKVVKKNEPKMLNGAICSPATADTLTRALKRVTEEGTGRRRLSGAKCAVAGKTGTARIVLDPKKVKRRTAYEDFQGRKQYQATFVGFFPADEPKYTAIVVIYSNLDREIFYGGTTPAMTFREIVDKIYAIDPDGGATLYSTGKVPNWN